MSERLPAYPPTAPPRRLFHFAKALGLDLDLSAGGLGLRSKRYSMLVEDGTVKKLNLEPAPGKVEVSGGDTLLAQL